MDQRLAGAADVRKPGHTEVSRTVLSAPTLGRFRHGASAVTRLLPQRRSSRVRWLAAAVASEVRAASRPRRSARQRTRPYPVPVSASFWYPRKSQSERGHAPIKPRSRDAGSPIPDGAVAVDVRAPRGLQPLRERRASAHAVGAAGTHRPGPGRRPPGVRTERRFRPAQGRDRGPVRGGRSREHHRHDRRGRSELCRALEPGVGRGPGRGSGTDLRPDARAGARTGRGRGLVEAR